MLKLAPSILAADFSRLGDEIRAIVDAGCDMIHIDVMDGMYVPNISFGPVVISSIRPVTDKPFDVHLMIEEPSRYINDFAIAGADMITVHAEATKHLHSTVMGIKALGIKVGVSLNPATPIGVLEHILDELDMVLIMTVNPGFGGQRFIPQSIDKIRQLRAWIDSRNLTCDIQVDGGITLDNLEIVKEAGANVFVVGSAIFGKEDVSKEVMAYKTAFEALS